ncbi:PREDICTED: E3 ubiquitin-protein ligase RNF220 [Mandrillus leucophaeus]|nr:PREDICTED: E3 ubiquitin-protein ligase RNF220 [Mandrillus leucophaeus]
MDLHRAAFKMENSSYLPNPLASPALMVLASTAEASRDASIPCQQPRPFGVPVSVDKDVHIPFTNGSYTFASMYHRQGGVPGTFANRDFPPSLLHLHPQFAPPNLDCTPISMLNHSGVGAFRPFASTEDRESYQSAFTPAKRLKNCHDTESPHLRFSDADGKEYDFGTQLPSSSPGSLKVDDTGKKIFAVSGLISDREASSSPEDRNDRCKKKAAALFDSQAPICPICQVLLRPSELQEHMEQELEQLAQLPSSKNSLLKDAMAPGTPKSLLLSASIKREGESPTASPHSSATDDLHHSDRYQGSRAEGRHRRRELGPGGGAKGAPQREGAWSGGWKDFAAAKAGVGRLHHGGRDPGEASAGCYRSTNGSFLVSVRPPPRRIVNFHPQRATAADHFRFPRAARIGKMKRRKQDEGQREGSCMAEDDAVDIEHENNNRFEEYEWCGQKRIRATTLLEGGFRGSGFIMCSGKENPDSDADLDVDGDDTLEYGKPQYTEADVIPCTGEEPGEAKEREALRGAVLNGGPPSTRITPEFSKWANDEMPSTSNGESSKQEAMQKTCKNSDIEKITEDSAVTTFEALKARVRELERQLSRGDRYKCLICMDSYSMPLTSIQCWHVHCEECWLRTLGAKKLCPQCNTITAPGDLRRIYL